MLKISRVLSVASRRSSSSTRRGGSRGRAVVEVFAVEVPVAEDERRLLKTPRD